MSLNLNAQPAGFARSKNAGRQSLAAGGAERDRVVSGLVGLHVLGFQPERRASLLVLKKVESDTDRASERLAVGVGKDTVEIYQRRHLRRG